MAKRTLNQMALVIAWRIDKSASDSVLIGYIETALKLTLQEIIAAVPHARWLLDEDSLATTAAQQYVSLPADMDIDSLVSLRDETNNIPLVRIDPTTGDAIDPGRDLTGNEIVWWPQTVNGADRIYFLNRPDSIDTIKAIFGNVVTDPLSSATCCLPAKYEYGWIEGTMPKLSPRIKGIDVEGHKRAFKDFIENVVKRDANSSPGESTVMVSHRPRMGGGVQGPSFPADYDIR